MIAISALTGQRIPISATSAPLDTSDSTVLDVSNEPQMVVEKGKVSFKRNITYAIRTSPKGKPRALKLDIQSPLEPGKYPLVIYLTGGCVRRVRIRSGRKDSTNTTGTSQRRTPAGFRAARASSCQPTAPSTLTTTETPMNTGGMSWSWLAGAPRAIPAMLIT